MHKNIRFVFWGTPEVAVTSLNELEKAGLLPELIVTAPDKPAGRGMKMQSSPVKLWADERSIPILQPTQLDGVFKDTLKKEAWDAFVVVAYGKIIPQDIIDMPNMGVLNMHASLLPKHRGPSPIEAQILHNDQEVGVTIMRIDEKMDHGPILAQEIVPIEQWPVNASKLKNILCQAGAELLAETLPEWVGGNIDEQEQEHDKATYCKLIQKEDARIDLTDDPHQNYLKFLAYSGWPRVYFFTNNNKRVIITEATLENGQFTIKKVIPEGKKEVDYKDFLASAN